MKRTLLIAATAIALSAPAVPHAHAATGLHCSFTGAFAPTDGGSGKPYTDAHERVFEFTSDDTVLRYITIFEGKPYHESPFPLHASVNNGWYTFFAATGDVAESYTIDRQTGALTGYSSNSTWRFKVTYAGTCEAITLPAPKL